MELHPGYTLASDKHKIQRQPPYCLLIKPKWRPLSYIGTIPLLMYTTYPLNIPLNKHTTPCNIKFKHPSIGITHYDNVSFH